MLYNLGIYGLGYFGMLKNPFELPVFCRSENSILVVICAHNEERVIANLLDDLGRQDFKNFSVIVLCDNCTDRTVSICLGLGTQVYERHSDRKGKQFALQDFYSDLVPTDFDYVCVLDADNRVNPDFLSVMSAELHSGREVVQAYLDISNKNHTWVSRAYEINYRLMNASLQRGRSLLGFSAFLGGTGYIINSGLVTLFDCNSLVDDLEFTMVLNEFGQRVYFTDKTCVYDEKPVSFFKSYVQRLRWMRGTFDVARRYSWPLLRSVFVFGRLRNLELLVYLLNNYAGLILFPFWLVSLFTGNLFHMFLFNVFYYLFFVIMDRRSSLGLIPYAFTTVFFNISSMFIYVHGFLTQGIKIWVRTEHFGK